MSQADLVQSICSLQRFAGINETCKLDQATISLMGTPRCGMPDKSPADKARRKRRYTLHGTYWRKKVWPLMYLLRENRSPQTDYLYCIS